MEKVLELNENDELVIINKNTKKCVGTLRLGTNTLELEENNPNVKQYYEIKNIDMSTLKCYEYLNDFINNCDVDSMPDNLWKHFNKIYEYFYEKVMGNSEDNVISRDLQWVIKYEKS